MNEQMEVLAPERERAVAAPINPEDPIGLFKLAIESKAGADTLERVMAVRRELKSEAAKEAFDRAMAAFQAECPIIVKSKGVPDRSGKIAFSYCPFEDIVQQIKPLLQKHGLSYTLDTDVGSENGWVIAKCYIRHAQGYQQTSTGKFPLGTQTAIMSATQAYAAALTFACRRVFCNAFGIVPAGDDMEQRISRSQKPAGPSTLAADEANARDLARELWGVLETVRGKEHNWKAANQYMWDENLLGDQEEAPHLAPTRFKEIIAKCRKKLNL